MYKTVTSHMTLTSRISHRHLVSHVVEANWNVMAHAQKPEFVLRAKRTSPFKPAGGRQFSRLLAAEVCVSAVVMLDTHRSEVVWRVLATHSIRQFPFQFPFRASPRAITFQLESTVLRNSSSLWCRLHVSQRSRRICRRSTARNELCVGATMC